MPSICVTSNATASKSGKAENARKDETQKGTAAAVIKSSKRRSLLNVSNNYNNVDNDSKGKIELIEAPKVLKNAMNILLSASVEPIVVQVDSAAINAVIKAALKKDAQELSEPDLQELIAKCANLLRTKLNGRSDDFTLPNSLMKDPAKRLAKIGNAPEKSNEGPPQGTWLKELPIYVVNAKHKPIRHDHFPKRVRSKFCYICGMHYIAELTKCTAVGCSTRFHLSCASKSTLGGYTHTFMKRRRDEHEGLYCSRHHCTACFADHNRTRCFAGTLINCDQCELAWHPDCIPGGCKINDKAEITCPRHVVFPDYPYLHLQHCAYCQQKPENDEVLIKCTNCFRAAHFNCYREAKMRKGIEDTEEERSKATCHWCDMFDFVRYGEYAMARFFRQWWYPCQVVPNEHFPEKKNQLLGTIGYLCVKWLPFKGKVFYNLISHNRIIAMSDHDYFFVNEANKTDIFEEWKEAQKYMVENNSVNRPLKENQIPAKGMSNGEKMIKQIQRNRYSSHDLKTNRERLYVPDKCNCAWNANDRCGPSSNCINRALRLECPKGCGEDTKMGCGNRRISEGNNCIQVAISYFPGKGYGATALETVPSGGFVGEYVGEVISAQERMDRIERIAGLQSNEAQYYIMELDDRRAIDAQYYGNDMRYVNHSCSPNCMIQQIQSDFDVHLVLIARQDIRKGDELSFDYNMKGHGRSVPICHCGAPNCTGVLSADKIVKQAMYDWEENKMTSKLVGRPKAGRVSSLPEPQQKKSGSAKVKTPFSSSAPIKRKGSTVEKAEEEPKKRAKIAGTSCRSSMKH